MKGLCEFDGFSWYCSFDLPTQATSISRGYPIVELSFQGVIDVHEGIIHGNQRDRNNSGEIWSRDNFRDGRKVKS
jgi:hypothetical protein